MLRTYRYRIILRFEVTTRTFSKERAEKLVTRKAVAALSTVLHLFRRFFKPTYEVVLLKVEKPCAID